MRPSSALFLPSIGNVIFVSTLAVLVFRIGNGLLFDGDTGYHIRVGQEILKSWRVPVHDVFSFHSPPLKWTAHEWLSEVILALLYDLWGLTGVVIFSALLLAATHWLLYSILATYSTNTVGVMLVTVLAIATSATHWLARPHVFSLMLTTICYHKLNQFQYEGRATLRFLPWLMLFWVNLHGGYFLGLVLIGVYLGGNLLWSTFTLPQDSMRHKTKAKKLFVCLIVSVATCGINPIGFEILLFPLRLSSDPFIMESVLEFMSPNFHEASPFKYMLLAIVAAVAFSRHRCNPIEGGLLLLLIYMALYSARYVSLFAIILAPLLLKGTDCALAVFPAPLQKFIRKRNENLTAVDRNVRGYFWPLVAMSLVIGFGVSGNLRFSFDEKRFPVAAVNFMLREPISGKMFNHDEFGDYIIFAAWPRYRVFIDGRSDMYGPKWGGMYLQVTSLQPGWDALLAQNGITWIIFDTDAPLSYALHGRSEWHAIYSDPVATIFLKQTAEHAGLLRKYQSTASPAIKSSH